jgi:DinB superfamily
MAKAEVKKTASEAEELRTQLVALLDGGQAHATFEDAVADFPVKLRGVVPDGLPYSAWQIVEHIRIAQKDILDFSAPPTGGYHAMKWPEAYWPKDAAPASAEAWDRSVAAVQADREKFKALILKPGADLAKPFLWGTGQNLLREALLIADHNAYHVGELIVLRRLLGAWSASHRP